jgi:hypothetical protein
MNNTSKKKPTYEELEERIHRTWHFLSDFRDCPDANDWLQYHMMVALRILTGQSLKGTMIYLKETGEVRILGEE